VAVTMLANTAQIIMEMEKRVKVNIVVRGNNRNITNNNTIDNPHPQCIPREYRKRSPPFNPHSIDHRVFAKSKIKNWRIAKKRS